MNILANASYRHLKSYETSYLWITIVSYQASKRVTRLGSAQPGPGGPKDNIFWAGWASLEDDQYSARSLPGSDTLQMIIEFYTVNIFLKRHL
jgi:hypothetical protein